MQRRQGYGDVPEDHSCVDEKGVKKGPGTWVAFTTLITNSTKGEQ